MLVSFMQCAYRLNSACAQFCDPWKILKNGFPVPYPNADVRRPNLLVIDRREMMTARALIVVAALMLVTGCAATIHGTVQLVDSRLQPIPNESPKGAVVNMINTTAAVEQASSSSTVDEKGEFESPKDSIKPGIYKVEVSRIGYETQTETVEIGSFLSKKIPFKLRKIEEGRRKSIKGSATDKDMIINPGEVNIQPPAM